MFRSSSMDLTGYKLAVEANRVVAQANGTTFTHYDDTAMLSTATASFRSREGIGFFPLSVECEEKSYSIGKISGGFNKREGRASGNVVLTRRVIDRPMRPLFPKDYHNDMTLDSTVVCVDPDCNPELTAMLGSAITTSISDIPFAGPCATTQMGLIGGRLIINPIVGQKQAFGMVLTVASIREKVITIGAGTNETPGQIMIDAIFKAHEMSQEIIRSTDTIVAERGKGKHSCESYAVPEELFAVIRGITVPQEMEKAVFADDKQTREKNIAEITAKLEEAFAGSEEWLAVLGEAVYQYRKKTVRKVILKDHKRPDGRAITRIRHLTAEVDLLPRVHGSGTFTRGRTQVPSVYTLAPLSEAQKLSGPDENETSRRYMHHYNFLSFSVGETESSRGPGHREVGYGALAERVLIPVLPSAEKLPYAIRTVSKTMESNSSTSQAGIYASTLSLMVAGVPIKEMVVDTSCGLVTGDTDDDYLALTNTQGPEDFPGDMDFKVDGIKNGITTIQMSIKIHGLTWPIIEKTIAGTREARMYILDNAMRPAISEPRKHLNPYAPRTKQIVIDSQKIGDVVGKQGKIINKIIEETGARIDTTDGGSVNVYSTDGVMIDKAIQTITGIVTDIEAGTVFNGRAVRIMNSDAFVELAPNKDDVIHTSKLSGKRAGKVEDVVDIGDEVTVKVTEVDKIGRINLTMRPSNLTGDEVVARMEER